MNKRMLALGSMLCCSFAAHAGRFDVVPLNIENPLYTGMAAGYGTIEVDDGESDWVAGGKLFVGYRLAEQWAVELSARSSGDLDGGKAVGEDGVEPSYGIGLSVLGFANYREFSAFYRMGVEYSDYTLKQFSEQPDGDCVALSERGYRCDKDESEVGFLFGLGYEVMVTRHMGYRMEWESVIGGSDLTQHNLYVGVQFAF